MRLIASRRLALPAFALAAAVSLSALAGERGHFGVAVRIEVDGMLDPTLKQVTVDKVLPQTPAAQAGLQPGDEIVEIEGRPVAGAKAAQMETALVREVGQTLRLKVRKKAGGEPQVLTLVAARRPG